MEIRFDNKNAVVTGGAAGLGRGIALAFAEAGADIYIGDIDDKGAEETCKEIRAMGRKASYVHCDVSIVGDMERLMSMPPRLDILVHVAGIGSGNHTLLGAPQEFIDRIVGINLLGPNNALRAALPRMIPNKAGKVVLVSSIAARLSRSLKAHYAMTKTGVLSLTVSAADAVAKDGINVNAVCPGIIRTTMWETQLDRMSKEQGGRDREEIWEEIVKKLIPSGRVQTVEDVANVAMFLCSDMSKSLTGQIINVSGDMVMRV